MAKRTDVDHRSEYGSKATRNSRHFSPYLAVDFNKRSSIDWIETPVNILLLSRQEHIMKNNIICYMYPAVKLNFISEIAANTLIIYDRFVPADKLDALRSESAVKNVSDKVEFWSMIRLLTIGHSFGEMAPGMCIKSNSQISR